MKINEAVTFLNWLKNRMLIKHDDRHPQIVKNIDTLIMAIKMPCKQVNTNIVVDICKDVYPCFNLNRDNESTFDVGYSEKEKQEIIYHSKRIIEEYLCRLR